MSILSVLRTITDHPLNKNNKANAVFRFLKWQVNIRLNPYSIIYPFTDKSSLIIGRGMAGATGNLYCGLFEFEDMSFLLHFLREGDLFVDVGANIGSYTVLAAAHANAKVISVEPLPATFFNLMKNISVNQIHHKVKLLNNAIGAKIGMVNFTTEHDAMNHVATDLENNTIEVSINTLDNIVNEEQVPILLKIDVEGFETEVIKGATDTLLSDKLKAIIIELNGSGSRYGYNENDIHNTLISNGFQPYAYSPISRTITLLDTFNSHNTIYLRDIKFVSERIEAAETFKIFGKEF